jgi:hypothetical protein
MRVHRDQINLYRFKELKNICWGSATTPLRPFWLRSGIILHKPEEIFAYGIKASDNGTKSFLMSIQAYFLKHLFFENKKKEKQ